VLDRPLSDEEVRLYFANLIKTCDNGHFHLKHRGELIKNGQTPIKTLAYECAKRRNEFCETKVYVHYSNVTLRADIYRTTQEHNHAC
jgi:hypothetical protein